MITWLEIVDTAVKVGLGALIGGATTYYISKLNHDKEMERDRLRRKREILEAVAKGCQDFSSCVRDYLALMFDWMAFENPDESIPNHRDRIEASQQALYEGFHHLTAGECNLLLVGEKSSRTKLREYGEFVQDLYKDLHVDGDRWEKDRLVELKSDLRRHYEAMFDALSHAYSRNR